MSKYDIEHACGHTVTHNLVGREADRERRAEWLATTDCSECWQAKQAAKKAAKEAEAISKTADLPPLVGTEKQVEWGTKIRAEYVAALREKMARMDVPDTDKDATEMLVAAAIHATFWIEARNSFSAQSAATFLPYDVMRRIAICYPDTDPITEKMGVNLATLHTDRTGKGRTREEMARQYCRDCPAANPQKAQAPADQASGAKPFCVPAHAIAELKYVPKVDKYIAAIEFPNHPKAEFWISEKQAKSLDEAFAGERYSTKANQAYVILEARDNKLRFVWAAAGHIKAEKRVEHFGAEWGWPGEEK